MITEEEIKILSDIQEANSYYYDIFFAVLMDAGGIMSDRVKKYSGTGHPYYNFADVCRRTKKPMDKQESLLEVFEFYRAIKASRKSASGGEDFSDESNLDSYIDEINYLILEAGVVHANLTPEKILPPVEEDSGNGARTISIDFDGVLNEFRGWTGKYEQYGPRKDVNEFISKLSQDYRLVILTARPTEDLPNVVEWLKRHNLLQYFDTVSNIKEPAIVYLDDRGYRFGGFYHSFLSWIKKDHQPFWHHLIDND